jgi:hypothetical protein
MGEPVPSRRPSAVGALGRLLLGHLAAFRDARLQDVATGVLRPGSGRQAWVVSVVNGSLRARQALTRVLYLEPRTLASRARFALRDGRAGRSGERPQLSLLCPTRGRVRMVATFLRSLQRTAAVPQRIEALFYVDADDPDVEVYRRFFAGAARRYPRLGRCVLRVGEPVGVPAAWNALAEAARGDLLLMANDDQLYVDYGWDVRLDARMAEISGEHPDRVCCLYFDAGQYPDGAGDFPIVSRRWYEALGYFTPTIFQQWEVERWLFDLARRVGRLFAVPGVFVEHRHYQDYKAPFDATYRLHRMTRDKSFADHALFLRTARSREQEAAALRRAMTPPDPTGEATAPRAAAGDPGEPWFQGYLEEHLPKIRSEVAAVLEGRDDVFGGRDRLDLFHNGQWQHEVCAVFPVTAGLVSAIPEATTLGPGSVSLWRLGGQRQVPHHDPAGGISSVPFVLRADPEDRLVLTLDVRHPGG